MSSDTCDFPAKKDFDEWMRKWELEKQEQAAMREQIAEQLKGARVVSFKNERGGMLYLHPAVRKDRTSDWQLTTISYDGVPWGHNNPPSFLEGAYRALGISEDGYWNEHGYSIHEVAR
jgi:hypothetical protein